ncbi:hypothetical protein DSQ20_04695 [Nitrosarchaeum sp. AC2]|nr:hypothetical protein DSQ20_04695 [Nitrosarchaeum sp. AC2]
MKGIFIFSIIIFASIFTINPIFGESQVESSNQITLSGDLANNPIAQDILKKIEQSKNKLHKSSKKIKSKTRHNRI